MGGHYARIDNAGALAALPREKYKGLIPQRTRENEFSSGNGLKLEGENGVETGQGITIVLATSESLGPKFEEGLTQAIDTARGEDTRLRIFNLLEAPMHCK